MYNDFVYNMIKEIWNIATVERSCRVNKWQFHMFLFQVLRKLSFNVLWYLGRHTGLISSDSFQITTLTDVSLWKFSHCGYKKWFCHFYSCPINKSDIWLQFDNNEQNPPDGADMQKNKKKQIFELLYLHYWRAPRDSKGVKRCARIHGIWIWRFGALIWSLSCIIFEKL